jgi:transcriptional regulator with XRE-family HTH domain
VLVVRRPPDPALGQAIRELRRDRELSQERLAHASDISLLTLNRTETGAADPRWTTVAQIAHGLGVTVAEVAERADRLRRSK